MRRGRFYFSHSSSVGSMVASSVIAQTRRLEVANNCEPFPKPSGKAPHPLLVSSVSRMDIQLGKQLLIFTLKYSMVILQTKSFSSPSNPCYRQTNPWSFNWQGLCEGWTTFMCVIVGVLLSLRTGLMRTIVTYTTDLQLLHVLLYAHCVWKEVA